MPSAFVAFAYSSTASKVGSAATTVRPGARKAASAILRISPDPQPRTTCSGRHAVQAGQGLLQLLLLRVGIARRGALRPRHGGEGPG